MRRLPKESRLKEQNCPKLDSAYLGPDWYWRDLVIAHTLMNEAKALSKVDPVRETTPHKINLHEIYGSAVALPPR